MEKATPAKKSVTKSAASKTPVKKAAPARTAARKSPAGSKAVDAQTRYKMIADAAYFNAEKQGFQGDHVQNWLAAEAQIDAMLKKS